MDRLIVETCKIRIIYQRDFRAFRLCFSLAFFLPGTLERLTCRRTRKQCFSVSIRNIADEHSAARRQQITGSVDELYGLGMVAQAMQDGVNQNPVELSRDLKVEKITGQTGDSFCVGPSLEPT